MCRTPVTFRTLVVTVTTGILFPLGAAAQGNAVKSAPPLRSAEQFEIIASGAKVQQSDWIDAAKALEQAARLRAASDPQAVTDLFSAASAYQTAGKLTHARWAVVDAARRAARQGDHYTAAVAYIAAAQLSVELKDPVAAYLNAEHAQQLTESSRITPDQKRNLLMQMGHPVEGVCQK